MSFANPTECDLSIQDVIHDIDKSLAVVLTIDNLKPEPFDDDGQLSPSHIERNLWHFLCP